MVVCLYHNNLNMSQAQGYSHFLLTFSMAVSDRACALSLQCSGAVKSVPCQVLSPGAKVTWPSRLTVSVAGLIAKGVSSFRPDAPVHATSRHKIKVLRSESNCFLLMLFFYTSFSKLHVTNSLDQFSSVPWLIDPLGGRGGPFSRYWTSSVQCRDWSIGRTWGTIRQTSSSSLFSRAFCHY